MLKVWIAAILVLWVAGMLTSNTFSGWIHFLPFLAAALFFLKGSNEYPTRPGDRGPRMKTPKDAKKRI